MQCFLCMTYMLFICNALPARDQEASEPHEERSLFRDVIESLKIRSQLPEDAGLNEENNLSQNYDRYGYDSEPPQLPSDVEFIPRRNDRIEMPTLNYRFPKSLQETNESNKAETTDSPKEEIVLYITQTPRASTTVKPKKTSTPKKQPNKKNEVEEEVVEDTEKPEEFSEPPMTNTMAGQSQIGNRESQIVLKPTVIVNIRGSVKHSDGEIRLTSRMTDDNKTITDPPQNVFNIKQEVHLERTFAGMGSRGGPNKGNKNKAKAEKTLIAKSDDSDMMMCETETWKDARKLKDTRRVDNVLQILFSY